MHGSLYLARQLITKRKIRFVFLLISITAAIAAVFVLFSLQFGVRDFLTSKVVSSIGVTDILVKPKYRPGLIQVNKEEVKEITDQTAAEIKNLPNVLAVYPNVVLKLPTSIQVSIFGSTFQSDAPVFGVAKDLVENDLPPGQSFDAQSPEIPVVISRDLVDFYNTGFADSLGQPRVNEDFIIGRTFTLFLGYSSFLGFKGPDTVTVTAKIVGFSGKVPLIGVSIPLEKVEEYTQKFNRGEAKVNSLFVKVATPADVELVSKQINDLGYATDSLQTRVAGVNASVNALTLVLGMISLIILLSTVIAIFNTFFSDVFENITTIGILRSVGATRGFIFRLITNKAVIVSFVGGIMGVVLGTIVSLIANFWLLRELPFLVGHGVGVISLPWTLFAGTLLFALLLGIVASLYPAHYGSRLDPAQALRRG